MRNCVAGRKVAGTGESLLPTSIFGVAGREIVLPALLHAVRPSDIGGSATLLAALGSSAASQMLLCMYKH